MSNICFRQVRFLAIIILGMACSRVGFAAENQINLELEEIYSSNITLVPNNIAFSDFVTRINPSLSFAKDGKVIELSIDYNYETFLYANNSDLNQDYHQLDSDVFIHLIGDELTLSGEAIYTQVTIDPAKPPQDSNISVTGNRSNGLYWGVTPQWQRQLPLNSMIDVNYTYGQISYDDPGIQALNTQTLAFVLASDPAAALPLSYELNYNYWFYDYETTGSVRDQNLYFSLSQEVGYGFSLIELVGLDSDFTDPNNSTLSDGRWEVGFESASEDGHVRAMIGRRYFGTVLRFSVGRKFAGWDITASYLEEPGTAESVFLQTGGTKFQNNDDSSQVDDLPPSGIDRPGSSAQFLRKRMDAGVRWEGRRSDMSFNAWWDLRDNLTGNPEAGIDLPSDDESIGAVLGYGWEIGAYTTTSLTGSWVRRKFTEVDDVTTFNEIDIWQFGAGINYLLGLKTSLGMSLTNRKSRGAERGDNYSEFQASINLTRSF